MFRLIARERGGIHRFVVLACVIFGLSTAVTAASAGPNSAKRRLTCDAIALTPWVDAPTRTGGAHGGVGNNCPYSTIWSYDLRLKNNAGNTLGSPTTGAAQGNTLIVQSGRSCAGAIVHTFVYVNVDGAGKSDTSGTNSDCAY
jgi:hypothetical protein